MTRTVALLAVLLAVLSAGCEKEKPPPPETRKLVVTASIYPIADMVKQIGGQYVDVRCMLPTGASPESFASASPVLLEDALKDARLVIAVGTGLDDWAGKAAESAKTPPAVLELAKEEDFLDVFESAMGREAAAALRRGEPLPASQGASASAPATSPASRPAPQADPYVWLDPTFGEVFVTLIAEKLARLDPANAPRYVQKATEYLSEVQALSSRYRRSLGTVPNKTVIVWRPVFSSAARRDGLTIVAASEDGAAPPTPARTEQILKLLKDKKAAAVFTLSTYKCEALESIANQTPAKVLPIDPLGGPDVRGGESYTGLLRSNLDSLLSGLETAR